MTRVPRSRSVHQSAGATSMYDELARDPRGRNELAAAELALDVQALIHRAFEENSTTARAIAELLGVTEGRVSQIRNGDGNVRISTLAKVMSALGKRVRISVADLEEVDGTGAPTAHDRRDRPLWTQRFVAPDGVHECTYEGPQVPIATPLGEPEWSVRPLDAETKYVRGTSQIQSKHGSWTRAWAEA